MQKKLHNEISNLTNQELADKVKEIDEFLMEDLPLPDDCHEILSEVMIRLNATQWSG